MAMYNDRKISSEWTYARNELTKAITELGYPAELGDVIAKYIGSPKGMERMVSYLHYVRPEKVELGIDEMIAVKSDIDRWREKIESERANAVYNSVLNFGLEPDE